MLLNILSSVAEVITEVVTGLFANNNCETVKKEEDDDITPGIPVYYNEINNENNNQAAETEF